MLTSVNNTVADDSEHREMVILNSECQHLETTQQQLSKIWEWAQDPLLPGALQWETGEHRLDLLRRCDTDGLPLRGEFIGRGWEVLGGGLAGFREHVSKHAIRKYEIRSR